jgi:hypothetical protein
MARSCVPKESNPVIAVSLVLGKARLYEMVMSTRIQKAGWA